ncbi:DUF3016 domain-containing protein [Ramlibacter sp.]|uniref:DUF3016 domain-containing protein n=1 Tax=Ramlibacter sp. TaxID=1917967 RepID=UPI002C51E75C|nr:DUF3016 domain-containing protein [Ramlibacter sp.]HWI83992.1 DUF3016 domain-containing protein [Ramlibacter sp.]
MSIRTPRLLLAPLAALSCAAAAGAVQVSFVDPASFTDLGTSRWDEAANMQAIERHLQSLGARLLPADQVLTVDVLEVDLAGTVRPSRLGSPDLRVITGTADFPRLHLRYTLARQGVTERSGEDRLADLNYTRGLRTPAESQSLYYEKRMLDAWFKGRFVDGRAD